MNLPPPSEGFQRLYCDPSLYENFSTLHPISFKRVLPVQSQDPIMDDPRLIEPETAFLSDKNDDTRLAVLDAYVACGLLTAEDAGNVKYGIDYYRGSDFFDFMGLVYSNAGMHICALRWYREHLVELEAQDPRMRSDDESVYASVGYSLYALGMFEEAVVWTKSCIGPFVTVDIVGRTLVEYEAQRAGGSLGAVERSTNRTRYTIRAPDPGNTAQIVSRLKQAIETLAPFQEIYIDWALPAFPLPIQEGYPFRPERDNSNYLRHKMNFLFAACGLADALIAKGYQQEAKRLLFEAALLEPNADFIQERIKALPDR